MSNNPIDSGAQPIHGHSAGRQSRVAFLARVLSFTKKILATSDSEKVMPEVAGQICALFDCEWFVLYAVSDDRASIVSLRNGPGAARDLTLPISNHSVPGYVAMHRRLVSIRNVFDDAELASQAPGLQLSREAVDANLRTKRSCQMLVAPILGAEGNTLLGVLQLVNIRSGRIFRSVAAEGIKVLCAALAVTLRHSLKPPLVPPLAPLSKYDALMTDGVLSAPEFERASSAAIARGCDIEQLLVDEYRVRLSALGAALAKHYGVRYEPFRTDRTKPGDLLKNIKREFVEHNGWLLIEQDRDKLVILALDPDRTKHSRIVNNIFPKNTVEYCVTTQVEFKLTVDSFFGGLTDGNAVTALLSLMNEQEQEQQEEESQAAIDTSACDEHELVRLINQIIVDAYRQGASDIHIEPGTGSEKTQVRFRKDGSLETYIEIPASYRNALLARIKIMCALDISEHRMPQDGKIRFSKFGPLDIELRVATIPAAGAVEDVVMRILAAGVPTPLEKLHVLPHNLLRLKQVITKPHGLFFVCGPTGSGKTTTLHSVLHHLNTPETKIWTAEDPVEITQKGLRQVQVNRKMGLDFATVMRSFLRADPDIIMVGEMRDKETVSIALEASLTGHLVFATLHTNSAPESIVRLLDMGMDPFNFADALLGVLAQRLAKRLCVHCRVAYQASEQDMDALLAEYCGEVRPAASSQQELGARKEQVRQQWAERYADSTGHFTLYRPLGCSKCNNGYKGRIGLHELMIATDKVKHLLQERARVEELLTAALDDGMCTLKMDGMEKVLLGATDMKQVRLVCMN